MSKKFINFLHWYAILLKSIILHNLGLIMCLLQGQKIESNHFLEIFIFSFVKMSKRRKENKKMIEESKKMSE